MRWENPSTSHKVEAYQIDLGIMEYEKVYRLQRQIVAAKVKQSLPDILISVEHDTVFTMGRDISRPNISFNEDFIRSKNIC